ncbi:MAG: GGDEF domain-containing protein [Magnetospiraceae bacterium]
MSFTLSANFQILNSMLTFSNELLLLIVVAVLIFMYLKLRSEIARHRTDAAVGDQKANTRDGDKFFHEAIVNSSIGFLCFKPGGEIERFSRGGPPLAVFLIDIDHFKRINDTYGHAVGDECLIHLSEILKEHSRAIDTVARWGGEEFMVVCPMADQKGAMASAERLRRTVAQCDFPIPQKVTISIGVAIALKDEGFRPLFNRVDQALYKAKSGGRNLVIFAEQST